MAGARARRARGARAPAHPVAAFFALAFPLLWLVTLVLVMGNPLIGPPGTEVRMAQFLTPAAAVLAVAMAAFVNPATMIVLARERGGLKRMRGTPTSPQAFLAGQALCSAAVALLGIGLMLAVGWLVFGVRLDGPALPAALLALLVAVLAFGFLALAVAALAPSAPAVQAVQAATIGSVIVLGFVSEMFTGGEFVHGWLSDVGWFFPLRHLVAALRDPLDPFTDAGFPWDHLAVIAGWGIAGAAVAVLAFRWEPRRGREPHRIRRPRPASRRRTPLRLVLGQVSYANRGQWRDAAAWFFAVAFPALLFVLLGTLIADVAGDAGYPQALAPGVIAYGAAVTAFVNLPTATLDARDRGVLQRLRGTPLPAWAYLAGRVGSALWLGALTAALVLVAGVAVFGLRVAPVGLPALLLVFVLGTATLLTVGMALAALLRTAKAYTGSHWACCYRCRSCPGCSRSACPGRRRSG